MPHSPTRIGKNYSIRYTQRIRDRNKIYLNGFDFSQRDQLFCDIRIVCVSDFTCFGMTKIYNLQTYNLDNKYNLILESIPK